MSTKIKISIITALLLISLTISFGAGCVLGQQTSAVPSQGLNTIEQAWNIIFNDYVDRIKLNPDELSQNAIRNMIETINDPYSAYIDPESYKLERAGLEGKYEGIGAHVTMKDEKITIIAPIKDSPAEKAGIRAGDVVLGVDGKSTAGMSITEVILLIRGPEGTPVTVLVQHEGETEPVEITIVRARIEVSSVIFEMRETIAYIQITEFSERTNDELIQVLEKFSQNKPAGIIMDLRNNPGGLLDVVIDVVSHFITDGVVVKVVDNRGNETILEVNKQETTITDIPMVILVNQYSASGSELTSGALQDYKRATIAGSTTFGKGSVNILRPLDDGSAIYITTARWLTPDGRLIEGKGIEPDYKLELEGEDAIQWAIDYLNRNR